MEDLSSREDLDESMVKSDTKDGENEADEDLTETSATDKAIMEAEAEYQADGKSYNAGEILPSLKRKYFDPEG